MSAVTWMGGAFVSLHGDDVDGELRGCEAVNLVRVRLCLGGGEEGAQLTFCDGLEFC